MRIATQSLKTENQSIDMMKLPEAAQRELVTFYEFLVFKYVKQEDKQPDEKRNILAAIFHNAQGKLPVNYTFNREEIHER